MKHWDIDYEWNMEGHYPFSMEAYINLCLNDKKISKKALIIKIFEVLERNDLLSLDDIKDIYGHEFDQSFRCKRIEEKNDY